MTEYNLLMEAEKLKQVDQDYRQHVQAYLNFTAKAEKKAGKYKSKPAYRNFKQFYDYEKELEKIKRPEKQSDKFAGLRGYLAKKGE